MNLAALQQRAIQDSRAWFPAVHESQRSAVIHFGLGIAGEVGELVNLIKKANREATWNVLDGGDKWRTALAHEAADVAIYLMDICSELGIDLSDAIEAKRSILIERWGDPERNSQ